MWMVQVKFEDGWTFYANCDDREACLLMIEDLISKGTERERVRGVQKRS